MNLDDEDPETIWALLQYIYTLEWPADFQHDLLEEALGPEYRWATLPRPVAAQRILWLYDINLWRAGDRYSVIGLADMAKGRLLRKSDIGGEFDGFCAFIRAIYDLGETEKMLDLRKKIVEMYAFDIACSSSHPVVQDMIVEIPALTLDLIKVLRGLIRT